MERNLNGMAKSRTNGGRALVVADWSLDPARIAEALRSHTGGNIALLVPARLRGLAWVGDPKATRPFAKQHLRELIRLCVDSGIPVEMAQVADPETVPAVVEALEAWPADEILLFRRSLRVRLPRVLSLTGRLARSTSLPVLWSDGEAPATAGGARLAGLDCAPAA
jgi:hypothetical protein